MRILKKLAYLLLLFTLQACTTKKDVVSQSEKPHSDTKEKTFRIISYNVLTGFQKKSSQAEHFIQWAKQQDADVIGFQELSTFTQDSLEKLAKRYGHNYAILHKGNGSPIGITSRYPFTEIKRVTDTMHHGCIQVKTAGIYFFVTHLSPFSYEKCQQEIKYIMNMASVLPKKEKVVIMGDLNSFSPADSLQYNHRRFKVVQSLLDSGYTDTFSAINKKFEVSFPTLKYAYKAKTPARIDYVFANKPALKQVISAQFIKDSVTNNLSDHYPLMVLFNQ